MKIFIKEYSRVGTHNYRLMAYWSRHGFGLCSAEDDHQALRLHLKASRWFVPSAQAVRLADGVDYNVAMTEFATAKAALYARAG